jgi:NADH-quinone oxidoreductase subunit M
VIPWLTILWVLPVVGSVLVAMLPNPSVAAEEGGRGPSRRALDAPKQLALGFSVATLVLAVALAIDHGTSRRATLTEDTDWIKLFGAHYALGLDGLGLTLVLLTAVLAPVVVVASWNDGDRSPRGPKALFAWMLALEGLSLGVFCATDVFLFYVFFEATLIPVYFMVAGYGGPDRVRAAVKFLLFSLAGGLIMLASVVGIYVQSAGRKGGPTYLLSDLSHVDFGTTAGRWMFVGFFIAFAIKAPMFPVHTWLPDTTEQATPGTSVMLVSVLDKVGTFGMIRFGLQLFPEASRWATPVVVVLAIVSILYGAFMAIGSRNILRLLGYTSVSHFGFIVLGIFVMNSQGLSGSYFYMFNHGLSTAAMFLIAGFLISRRGSALIEDYGGVEKVAPVLAGLFLVSGLSMLALPGLSPFVSELLVLVGAFVHSYWAAVFAVPGIVLVAIYVLWLYQRTMTGPVTAGVATMRDLGAREIGAVVPLLVLMVVLGFFPKPLLAVINPSVHTTMSQVGRSDPHPAVPAASDGKVSR